MPALDLIQKYGKKLRKSQIRVWCHPHYIGENGDDYWYIFKTLRGARMFIKISQEAEREPVIAVDGYEFTVREYREYKKKGKLGKNQKVDVNFRTVCEKHRS